MSKRKLRDPVNVTTTIYYRGTQIKRHKRQIPYAQALAALGGDALVMESRIRSQAPIRRTRTIDAVRVVLVYQQPQTPVEPERRRWMFGGEGPSVNAGVVRSGKGVVL